MESIYYENKFKIFSYAFKVMFYCLVMVKLIIKNKIKLRIMNLRATGFSFKSGSDWPADPSARASRISFSTNFQSINGAKWNKSCQLLLILLKINHKKI